MSEMPKVIAMARSMSCVSYVHDRNAMVMKTPMGLI